MTCTQATREELADTTSPVEHTLVDDSQKQITSRFKGGSTKQGRRKLFYGGGGGGFK